MDLIFLKKFPSFVAFYSPTSLNPAVIPSQVVASNIEVTQTDPEGSVETNISQLRAQVSAELLNRVKAISPQAFERLVVQMICRLGYGGSEKDAGEAIGKTGDGGIDGTIREDRLGLDVIYLQAKRWESVVGRPVVQAFVGALHGKHAQRGVMITTSGFTKEAQDYVKQCSDKVILVDGARLIDLMFEYNLGVVVKTTYEVKDVDLTYFEQFQ